MVECLALLIVNQHLNSVNASQIPNHIHSSICTFINGFLCGSNDRNVLLFFNEKFNLCQYQYDHDHGLDQKIDFIPKINANCRSQLPLSNRLAQILLRMQKLPTNLGIKHRRILLLQIHHQPTELLSLDSTEKSQSFLSHKIISLAYFCKNNGIICDAVGIEINSQHFSLIRQVSEIAYGISIMISRQKEQSEKLKTVLNGVLFGFIGLDVATRTLMPVKSGSGIASSAQGWACCNCHGKALEIGYLCPICLGIYCENHHLEECQFCGCKFEN